jgi:F-type H+-transporting ATPase subunit delta
MLRGATARRYAEAVFEIGTEQGTVERWLVDLRTVADYFGNKRLQFVLSEPKIPAQRKEQVVRDLLADKVQPEALNLALLLVERALAPLAPAIFQAFERRYNDYKGIVVAQVVTAIPLDDGLRAQIVQQLGRITGKSVQMDERVDPTILGGVVARVGDTLIDGSLRRRFELLREQIAAGNLGGPDDGQLAALLGPDGGSGPAGSAAPLAPMPPAGSSGTSGNGANGETSGGEGGGTGAAQATDAAPRNRGGNPSAHLGPRPTFSGAGGNHGTHGNSNGNGRRKRRRR